MISVVFFSYHVPVKSNFRIFGVIGSLKLIDYRANGPHPGYRNIPLSWLREKFLQKIKPQGTWYRTLLPSWPNVSNDAPIYFRPIGTLYTLGRSFPAAIVTEFSPTGVVWTSTSRSPTRTASRASASSGGFARAFLCWQCFHSPPVLYCTVRRRQVRLKSWLATIWAGGTDSIIYRCFGDRRPTIPFELHNFCYV